MAINGNLFLYRIWSNRPPLPQTNKKHHGATFTNHAQQLQTTFSVFLPNRWTVISKYLLRTSFIMVTIPSHVADPFWSRWGDGEGTQIARRAWGREWDAEEGVYSKKSY